MQQLEQAAANSVGATVFLAEGLESLVAPPGPGPATGGGGRVAASDLRDLLPLLRTSSDAQRANSTS